MSNSQQMLLRDQFAKAAREWIGERYQVQLRYVATKDAADLRIVQAMVMFHPWLNAELDVQEFRFHVDACDFKVGQEILTNITLLEALRVLDDALAGSIKLPGSFGKPACTMSLASVEPQLHYLWGQPKNPWANMIHMAISGSGSAQFTPPPTLDDALRRADVPFDGYADLMQWLSLNEFIHPSGLPSIAVAVYPPAKIEFLASHLANGKLTVAVDVMGAVDYGAITVAAMGTPPSGVSLRRQMRNDMTWDSIPHENRVRGTGTIELPNAQSALVVLSIGNTFVQRQWFSDPALSKNIRYAAVQEFDHSLTKIKERLRSTDSRGFEKAVAALMFMSGFAPLLPLEDEGPDIIGVTPGGQVALVECTVKTTDAIRKIGNLVARREALREAFDRGQHFNSIFTILVCQQPRAAIHASDDELAQHDVLLITREGLDRQTMRVQAPVDADQLCMNANELLLRLKARTAIIHGQNVPGGGLSI
jgi:hypothetical protein